MEFLARVNPKYLAAASLFAAKQDVRYYLKGVMIEPHPRGGAVLCATNGQVVGLIHDPHGYAKHRIIMSTPPAQLQSALKLKRYQRVYQPANCWIAERCAVVTYDVPNEGTSRQYEGPPELFGPNTIVTVQSTLIEAEKYPHVGRILPGGTLKEVYAREAGPMPAFKPDVLQPFLDAARLLGNSRLPELQIIYRGENESAVVRIHATQDFFGIAMPIRDAQATQLVPDFIEVMRKSEQNNTDQAQ